MAAVEEAFQRPLGHGWNRVGDAPAFLLLPKAFAHSWGRPVCELDGYAVYAVPIVTPIPTALRHTAVFDAQALCKVGLEKLSLHGMTFHGTTAIARSMRRRLARKGRRGRRTARAIPAAIHLEARVFAPAGTPKEIFQRAAEDRAVAVARTYKRPPEHPLAAIVERARWRHG